MRVRFGLLATVAFLAAGPTAAQTAGADQEEGGLNLEETEIPPESVQQVAKTSASKIWAAGSVALLLAAVGAAALAGKRADGKGEPPLHLGNWPLPAKLALTLTVAVFAAAHLVAAVTVYLDTRVVYSSTEEYFRYLKPARLSALSHAHLMGIATMEGLTGLAYGLSRRTSAFSSAIVTLALVGVIGDIGSWWLTKYAGAGFELLSIATGVFFSLGFAVMALALLRDMWLGRGGP
ncbi:MAG: hypothetical protein ACOZIN_19200 [Myxococcota bacterium]